MSIHHRRVAAQRGQALTEFVVVGVFVLVPLFLIIPVIAQLISQKQDIEIGARYAAWERTAWAQNGGSGLTKSDDRIAHEIDARIFAEGTQPIVSQANVDARVDPFSRRVNGARPTLIAGTASGNGLQTYASQSSDETAPTGPFSAVFNGLLTLISGATGFDFDTEGIYRARVSVPLIDLSDLFDLPTIALDSLTLSSQNALLTESWNAGGTADAQDTIQGLLPTGLVDNTLVDTAQTFLGALPLAHELDPACLDFGRVDLAPVPNARLGAKVGERGPDFAECNL